VCTIAAHEHWYAPVHHEQEAHESTTGLHLVLRHAQALAGGTLKGARCQPQHTVSKIGVPLRSGQGEEHAVCLRIVYLRTDQAEEHAVSLSGVVL